MRDRARVFGWKSKQSQQSQVAAASGVEQQTRRAELAQRASRG